MRYRDLRWSALALVPCAFVFSSSVVLAPSASSAAPSAASGFGDCTCTISSKDPAGGPPQYPGYTYTKVLPVPSPQPSGYACHTACESAAASYYLKQTLADANCALGVPTGIPIKAYAHYDNPNQWPWVGGRYLGTLTNTPAITTISKKCPPGWTSNTSGQPGDYTTDNKCKKVAGVITLAPYPGDGTQLNLSGSTWGFTYGNRVYAYGTPANGGAPASISNTTPAVCNLHQ